jgi:polysaccharide deacetylase 2 family uncharacterized protein YibQ
VSSSHRPFFFARWYRGIFPTHRRLFWGLLAFFFCFLVVSTAAVVKLQVWVNNSQAPDLLASSEDLHTLTSGSLALSGLHPEEILREETRIRSGSAGEWNEYFTEILTGDTFPTQSWVQGLKASLERADARLTTWRGPEGVNVEVRHHPAGLEKEIIVERILVRTRPSPETIPSGELSDRPRAALVIDDLGQNPVHFRRLVALGIPLTVSILPGLPYSRRTAQQAADLDIEILLHLPMEPVDFPEQHPGPGALFREMDEEEVRKQLEEDLESVPGARGVNNHMGSRLTADLRTMEILMGELKTRKLFFLDSRTSPRSLAFDTAYRFDIPAASRDIFLDAHDDEDFIRGQVLKLLERARSKGRAIGIGHPHGNTFSVLEQMIGELKDSGIEWVPVSELLVRNHEPEGQSISSLRGEEGER